MTTEFRPFEMPANGVKTELYACGAIMVFGTFARLRKA